MPTLIDTLYDQHRRMFVLLDLLEREIEAFAKGGAFDPYVVEGALDYIAVYPDRLHRPIELLVYEAYRRRKGGEDPLATAATAAEHEVLSARARDLKNAVIVAGRGPLLPRDLVAGNARRLIEGLRHHMAHEEDTILPAARAALSSADLDAIRGAIELEPDAPSIEAEETAFADLYDMIVAQDRRGLVVR